MVKKISVYTAFGQFIAMIEKQLNEEQPESFKDTDWFQCEHTLSDYQDALSALSTKSCPIRESSGPVDIRKTSSCPLAAFACSLPPVVSPVPTTIESRKMNEATEMMLSFWKIHVTLRKKREEMPSLFEKLDGLFTSSSSTTSLLPSLFEKLDGIFDPEEASLFEKLDGFFTRTAPDSDPSWNSIPSIKGKTSEEDLSSSTLPETLVCCSCKASWTSLDNPAVPQLPVFVKSPIDSLKIYEASKFHQNTGEMADDELTVTVESEELPISSCSSSDTGTIVMQRMRDAQKIKLQQEAIEKQEKIIKDLIQLNDLYSRLARAD